MFKVKTKKKKKKENSEQAQVQSKINGACKFKAVHAQRAFQECEKVLTTLHIFKIHQVIMTPSIFPSLSPQPYVCLFTAEVANPPLFSTPYIFHFNLNYSV